GRAVRSGNPGCRSVCGRAARPFGCRSAGRVDRQTSVDSVFLDGIELDRRQVMRASVFGAVLLIAILPPGTVSAQTPARVSFRSDVLPLLKEHCVSCHGPAQQMNGLRLDRRSAAMTGGTITVLIPGNSAASRLYLKLVGTQYGQQMPPSGRLADRE